MAQVEEIIAPEDPQTDPDPLSKLYKVLSEQQLYTKSFDEFKQKYNTPESIDKLYGVISAPEQGLYTKSKEEFYKKYFPTQTTVRKDVDLMGLAREKKRLSNILPELSHGGGGFGMPVTDSETQTKIKAIDQQLTDAGYDPEEVAGELGDMPVLKGFNPKAALQLKKDNPLLYNRQKAAINSQYDLAQAVNQKEGANAANKFIDSYVAGQFAKDYPSQRQATKEAIAAVHNYVDDPDEQSKLIKDIVTDKSYGYGAGLPGQDEALKADPRYQALNPYQVAGLQFLEDVQPDVAQSYNRLLSFSPEELEAQKSNTSFMRGYEAKARDLENVGINLMAKSLEEKLTAMNKNKASWTPEQKQQYQELYNRYEGLAREKEGQLQRYPAMAVMDADQLMQDAMQQSKKGVVERTVLGIGENVEDLDNWIGSVIKAPFTSSKQQNIDDLELMGDKRLSQLSQYETESEKLYGGKFKSVFKGELKDNIDAIRADSNLDTDEKQEAITKAILYDRKNVDIIPNDKAGKLNFTGKSTINAVSNIGSEIFPQIVIAYLTGGGANATKVKELASLFGSTFATAYNDYYNEAIEKNIPKPSQYATVHTTIEAASELLNNNVAVAKKLFGGKSMGKILDNITQEEMDAIVKKGTGRFAKMRDALIETGKIGGDNALQESYEEIVGQAAGNVADKQLFNQDTDFTDDLVQTGVSTFIGMLPLSLLGLPMQYNKVNQMQKYALYEAGMNPDKFKLKIDEDLQSGKITEVQADAAKKRINQAQVAIQQMEAVQPDGTILSDNEKTELAFNNVVQQDIDAAKGNPSLTEEQTKQLEEIEKELKEETKDIISPKTKTDGKSKTKRPKAEAKKTTGDVTPTTGTADIASGVTVPVEKPTKTTTNEQTTTGERGALPTTEKQTVTPKGSDKSGRISSSDRPKKVREEKVPGTVKEIKSKDNAIQKQKPTTVPVQPAPPIGKKVGERNESKGSINKETAGEKEELTVDKNVKLVKDEKVSQVRADKLHSHYDIISGNKKVGNVSFNDRGNRYQIENIKVDFPRQGLGTDVYKTLIRSLDKPLASDSQRTASAQKLWEKLQSEGLAYYNKEEDRFYSQNSIQTEQDVEKALQDLNVAAPAAQEAPATTPEKAPAGQSITFYHAGGKVKGKVVGTEPDGRLTVKDATGTNYKVKPKDVMKEGETPTEHYEKTKGNKKVGGEEGVTLRNKNDNIERYTPSTIIDEARKFFKGDPLYENVTNFLEPILKKNPNIRIDTSIRDFSVAKEYRDEPLYEKAVGIQYDDGTIIQNFARLNSYEKLYEIGLHELVHSVTSNEIKRNKAFRDELQKVLDQVRTAFNIPPNEKLAAYFIQNQTLDRDLYGGVNEHELLAEVFTNKAFFEKLKSIEYEGDNLLHRLFLIIAKWFSENYKQLAESKAAIDVNNLADYLIQLTQKVINDETVVVGEDTGINLALNKINNQEEAIKEIIQRTPNKVSDARLLEIIEKATKLPAATIQQWIDDIRKPPIPPTPPQTVAQLSPESRELSLKKFDQLFKKADTKEKSWLSKTWGQIKNASAWIENPYRFVTKITEDINKQYKLGGREAIPLGRAFEKSAAGIAVTKTDSFINEVLRGNIGDERLGQLKGEKLNDFQKYMAAKRVIDRIATQEKKNVAGEVVNRQTGNITQQDAEVEIEYLEQKYGPDGMADFNKRADAFQYHMNEVLKTLVNSGILSQDAYESIKEDNDFYAPFSVIQEKLLPDQDKQPVGISGVVKRIKGIGYKLPTTTEDSLSLLNTLADSLTTGTISPEEYFNSSVVTLQNALQSGQIDNETYEKYIGALAQPGFAINGMIDAAANMIYKAQGMALKNTMMQRLYAYKVQDTQGLFIQDVDGFTAMTLPNGDVRMVPKPLNSIRVEKDMAPVKLRVAGKDKIVAINKYAAQKLNDMNNFEMATWMKGVDILNKVFRAFVITTSPGFQAVNFMIDFIRTTMLSRYGLVAGKGVLQPIVNMLLYIPQYMEAIAHSTLGNLNLKTNTYKQWMNSESFSRGMFDNLFDNEKRVKEITASKAKRILNNFLKLKFIEVPGSILEQSHKILTHQRGTAVEGMKSEMFTTMLSSLFNQNLNSNMTKQELSDAMDRLNYEVQNYAGSPNFPQTHKALKIASIFLQFFSARVKGEVTDYRRVSNLFTGHGEGVKMSAEERVKLLMQFTSVTGMIALYAISNVYDDDDEKEFNSIPSYHQDNYLNIPAGEFEYTDSDGNISTHRDYIKIPLRGLTATMNVTATRFAKFWKHGDREEFNKAALNFLGNVSPVNLHGKDSRELGESMVSNLTPVYKYFMEYSFNRDTHAHRDIIPDSFGPNSMLEKYRRGDLDPWEVTTPKTPDWAIEMSRFLYDELGIRASPIELDHMENTMGNPTELYNDALEKRLIRSKMRYPVVEEKK